MLTECPSCQTVFRVTGAILKMGHGQVRCGKCRTQFDALESLLDEEEEPAAQKTAATTAGEEIEHDVDRELDSDDHAVEEPAEEAPAIVASEPAAAEEITLEGSRIEISGTYRVPTDAFAAEGAAAPEQIIHEHHVIERDESALAAEDEAGDDSEAEVIEITVDARDLGDGEPVAEAAHHLLPEEPIVATPDAAPPVSDKPQPLAQRIWKRAGKDSARRAEHRKIAEELEALTEGREGALPTGGIAWRVASVALVLALLAQMVHHNRESLARNPTFGTATARIYGALGLTLAPWDINAYELQQWGVIPYGGVRDALRVRASVTNRAAFAQPFPLIKIVLEDRWGSPVAMRTFQPAEYLPTNLSADRMMAPNQRANAEVVIMDPGVDAVGFKIHQCLPQEKGVLCFDDLPAGAAR